MRVFIAFCFIISFQRPASQAWNLWKFSNTEQFWKRKHSSNIEHFSDSNLDNIPGKVLTNLLGYPSKCQLQGSSHSCTLSVACWWAGGSSRSGCGTSRWIVACCVPTNFRQSYFQKHVKLVEDGNEASLRDVQTRENIISQSFQRRTDFMEDFEESCGLSNDRLFQKRIVGGTQADFGQFPWQAYIKITSYQCGGVLVSKKFVATAAHCILAAKITDLLVYLGDLDIEDTGDIKEPAPAELHRVNRRLIHPKFHYKATQPDRYDLALLELITETGWSFHISPICLPDASLLLTGREAVVAGWGKTDPLSKQAGTNVLRSVTVPILDFKECMAWHKRKQILVELHSEMLCAGHKLGKHDACLGDSGGPLILLENGRWTLVGITSAGFGCGEAHQPGIYHKVPMSVNWIKKVIYNKL
ncbi:trypsin-7 [Euwallacea fornicatus]|uniref:trypsin-7 n=1 Tax=Euwallacea fornicatus TaxID=995702 RepID=UPI0033904606